MSKLEFLHKAKEKYGDKYNYAFTDYTKALDYSVFYCYKHGFFYKRPVYFLRGTECTECKKEEKKEGIRRKFASSFIEKAKKIHGDKYDYSEVDYIDVHTKIKIKCKIHGVFEQSPNCHLNGVNCQRCTNTSNSRKKISDGISKVYTRSWYLKRLLRIHKYKYGYDQTYFKSEHIKVFCKNCNDFFTIYKNSHLRGVGCKNCRSEKNQNILDRINKVQHNKYKYLDFLPIKRQNDKIKIWCDKHGIFKQSFNAHLLGQGCPKCKYSRGEEKVEKILNKYSIKHIREKSFSDCKGRKQKMPFDFYLPNNNLLIEYDGRQHFEPVQDFGGEESFKELKRNEKIKEKYARDNNINLLRISYKQKHCIEDMILSKINNGHEFSVQ